MTYVYQEPTPFEAACSFYSDMHKATYGFRPRSRCFESLEEVNEAIEDLSPILEDVLAEEEQNRQLAIVKFMETVRQNCESYNVTPYTALKWMIDAEDDLDPHGQGIDAFMHFTGMPYTVYQPIADWFRAEYRKELSQ